MRAPPERIEAARRDGFNVGVRRVHRRTPNITPAQLDQTPSRSFIPIAPADFFGELYRVPEGWVLQVAGCLIELSTPLVMAGHRSKEFGRRVQAKTGLLPPKIGRREWEALIRERLERIRTLHFLSR